MSQRPCGHAGGEQLPLNVTCGTRCAEFPACIPSPSAELVTSIVRYCIDSEAEQAATEAVANALQSLHDAVTDGLAGREQRQPTRKLSE
jgi:hypothetical protein